MENASNDQNSVKSLLAVSNADGRSTVTLYADPVTHRLLVDLPGGSGTVTSVSVVTANGFSGTVATATTTPAITLATTVTGLLQGDGTAISAVTIGSGLSFTGGTLSATGSGLTVGTTTITSGTNGRVLYDNSGVLGELATTGSGSVVLATSATISSPVITSPVWDGWNLLNATLAYSSVDGPTGVVTTSVDLTGSIQPGMRVKFTQTTIKYFIVTAITSSSMTIYGGTDYTLANAVITLPAFSMMKEPFGFNSNPDKWTESYTTNSNQSNTSASPVTWYNVGSNSLTIPIGLWRLYYEVDIQAYYNGISQGNADVSVTLSTANNSQTDIDLTCEFANIGASNTIFNVGGTVHREKVLALASKTTYYLNLTYGSGTFGLYVRGDLSTTMIKAVCSYL